MPMPGLVDAVRGAGPGAVLVDVHVEPGSSRPGVAGFDQWRGRLRLRVAARPRGGEANREAAALLAEALGVPDRDVRVSSGATSRLKTMSVSGLDAERARARLSALLGGAGTAGRPAGGEGRGVGRA